MKRTALGTESEDSLLGCVLGGAIGDAFGGVAERGIPSLSDDTQLTLATCEAVAQSGRADPAAIAAAFLRWFRARRLRGLGSSTLKALRDLDAGSHWALSGAKGEHAAGNGGAMRIAPLAFVATADRATVRDVVRITHHNEEACLGALAVVLAIRSSPPASLHAALADVAEQLPDCRVRDQLTEGARAATEGGLEAVADRCGSSGWVVETIPLALSAAWFMERESFSDALETLIGVGGDTDTIAAIAGQIAGSRLGISRLPPELLERLPERSLVEDTARALSHALAA